MRIRRLEIRSFKKFRNPVVIDELGDGLTVIAGDNEEGKSTVLHALRTVLFEKYKLQGEPAKQLQPQGSDVQPQVLLDFEIKGARYSLHKGFCQQSFAKLEAPEGTLLNLAAEERLQLLLRYEPPGRGPSKLEHQGIWGLFWLEQGSGFENLPIRPQVRQTVLSALEGEVGAVLGGEQGRSVIAAVAQRYGELFTQQGKARGELKKASERVEQLEEELRDVGAKLQSYEEQVDALSKTRARLSRYAQERLLEQAQERRELQEREVQRIERLAERVRQAEMDEELARVQHEAALSRWREREKAMKASRAATERGQKQGELLATEQAALAPQDEACEQAKRALEIAEREREDAERGLQEWGHRIEQARAAVSAADISRRLELATAAQRAFEQARTRLGELRIDDRRLRELRKLERALIEAEAGMVAVATRVELALVAGQELRVHELPADPTKPLIISERTVLGLPGVGELTITPGATALAERTAAAAEARQALARGLFEVQARDLPDAERLLAERKQLESAEREQLQLHKTYAPEGIDALRTESARAEAVLREARPGEVASAPLSVPDAEQGLATARERQAQHRRLAEERRATWTREEQAAKQQQQRVLRLSIEAESARREAESATSALTAEREQTSDEELLLARQQREAELRRSQDETAAARAALLSADPEGARRELHGRERAVKLIAEDIEVTRRQAHDLEIELRTLGQLGLGERAMELEGERLRARALLERQERQAGALRLLHETLQSAEREAKEAFLLPVQRMVQPYLNILFPRCEVVFDEGELAIRGLRRDGHDEPFDSLSIGTREQLAVIARLGFADLLRGQGQPAPVILDDALVYSDAERFDAMLKVLQKASEHTQILVLTCRERDYRLLGAPIVRLASCVQRLAG